MAFLIYREWIKTHAICPTCRRSLHTEGPGDANTNTERAERERDRINAFPAEQPADNNAKRRKPPQNMGSVAFSLPKEAMDRDSIESEKKRVEVETINKQMLTKDEKNNKDKKKTE